MEKLLSKTSFVLLTVLIVLSCKDDPEPATETVLSKVFIDGKLESEYVYNSDRELQQILQYETSTGHLEYNVEFEYDTRGYLQNEIDYNADGKPTGRTQYLKDSDGKFINSERMTLVGADSGKVTSRYAYEYNEEGRISKKIWRDPDTGEDESYQTYFYYPNGNLERYEYFWTLTPAPEKAFEVRYSPSGRPLPESISKHRGYPINFGLYAFVAEQIKYEIFNTALGSPGEYHELISERMYDSEGFVTEQTITYKYIIPADQDEVIKMNLEYINI